MAPPSRHMIRLRKMLLRAVAALELPPNPLDHLTELLGGQDSVAEMTGRSGMLVRQADGSVRYLQRRAEVCVCACGCACVAACAAACLPMSV